MKLVKVLRPFGAYAVGDTPTLFGAVARDRRERGDVEWLDDVSDAAPAEPAAEVVADEPVSPAKPKPARRAKK
jgi:hypothetical protein